jgi:hypothetical protein
MERPDAEGDRMRISQVPTLAACLSIGGLAWLACGGLHDAAAAAVLAPASEASQCQAVPVTSTTSPSASSSGSASPSDSPTAPASPPAPSDLCVTVQSTQDSFQAGTTGTWTVVVWAHTGPVTGVTVALSGTIAGQRPTFTARCPGGDGGTSCVVGDLGTAVTASSYELQAQMAIPAGTAANSTVALTASANATPPLPATPAAAAAVIVTAAPAPASSPSSSSTPSTPSASSTPNAPGTPAPSKNAAPGQPAQPQTTPAVSSAPPAIPGIGSIPGLVSPVTPATGVTSVTNPGSIGDLLPVITPATGVTSPTAGLVSNAAAENNPASAGVTADRASASRPVFVIPVATAEALGIIVLLLFLAMASKLRATNKLAARVTPGRTARGAHGGPSPARRFKPSAVLHLRRQRSGPPKKDP